MASMQTDLHKYFKNKKKVFSQNKLINEISTEKEDKQNNEVEYGFSQETEPKGSLIKPDDPPSLSRPGNLKRLASEDGQQVSKKMALQKEDIPTGMTAVGISQTNMEKDILSTPTKAKEMKKQLGKCSNIHELRERLLKFKKCEEKLNGFRKNTVYKSPVKSINKLQSFKSIDIEVPVSPIKSPVRTPTKTVRTPVKNIKTPRKPYCNERYAHLVTEDTTLALPYKYDIIKEAFRAVDTVVSLMHNRHEVVTFAKLKPAVQEMLRKTFNIKQLGQVKAIFPLAYFFRQEKLNATHHGGIANDYHLTISANLKYKKTAARNLFGTPTDHAEKPVFQKMDSVVLVDRRKIFHEALLNILKSHHEKFLKSLDPPIELNGNELKNWHHDFALDEVPEPEESALPQPPNSNGPKTAQEIFATAKSLFSINNPMKNALESIATSAAKTEVKPQLPKPAGISNSQANMLALKGISASLVEKIRAREAAKAAREMTRSSEQTAEIEMHQRLPQIAKIIRNYFVTEKKAALLWESVSAKVASSYSSMMSASEVDAHLELLIKVVPGWCTVHKIPRGIFVKIDKKQELHTVLGVLQEAIKKL